MHFRCVFTMLKSCVLVGLDWAEPMMFLLLHVTCSCIWTIFVSIFLILICVGTFLILSLSVSYSMTPKRKSAPSRKPLRSGASTFDSTPSHIWFHDEKARMDFSENFSHQGICFGMPSHPIGFFRY